MKKRKLFIKMASALLCVSLFASSIPALALDVESSNQDEVLELDTSINVEEKSYSFIFQYGEIGNKSELIDAIEEAGGTVGFEIDYMNAVSALLTMDQLAIIKEMECVQYVERDYDYNLLTEDEEPDNKLDDEAMRQLLAGEPPVRENAPETDNPNVTDKSKPDSDSNFLVEPEEQEPYDPFAYAHERNIKGQNIKIALFDTGIVEHPDYNISGGVSFVGDMVSYTDTDGHGTKMAGIIAAAGEINPNVKGAAPEADLYAVKLVETEGESFITTAAILMGIGWSIDNGMDIINMSFGTYFTSKLLNDAINLAYANDILLVGAGGNDGGFADEYRIMYPAAYKNVIAVGAGGAYGTESFSNNNEKLDFVAPGRQQSTLLSNTYTDVVGTSASAAYVTGLLAGLWSYDATVRNETVLNIAKNAAAIADSQAEYVGFGEISLEIGLKNAQSYAILVPEEKTSKNSEAAVTCVTALELAAREEEKENMPMEMAAGNCFANEMANAISIPFLYWQTGYINCPGNEVWYKFTANASGNHPNNSPGWYSIDTYSSGYTNMDTVVYLYDSSGNQLAYNDDYNGSLGSYFSLFLDPYYTYYIRVKGFGSSTGSYRLRVGTTSDDHGNTFSSATNVFSVYYENQSVSGNLNSNGDIDMFCFVPARDSVIEIYTEGSTDTYGTLYNECQSIVAQDNNTGGNGQFKIVKELKAMQFYYIAVRHNSSTGYGSYTLKFKFLKDFMPKFNIENDVNLQRTYVHWKPDNGFVSSTPTSTPGINTITSNVGRVFLNFSTALHWNAYVVDAGTQSIHNELIDTLKAYAAETITTEALTAIVAGIFNMSGLATGVTGITIGAAVAIFSSAVQNYIPAQQQYNATFKSYFAQGFNKNSTYIIADTINYAYNFELDNEYYTTGNSYTGYTRIEIQHSYYGMSYYRGTFFTKFAGNSF